MDNLRERLLITFHSEDDIIRFVETCRHYDDAIDVTVGRMSTDAKSVMGMLLVGTGKGVAIDYNCYDDENNYPQFREEVMRLYDVKIEKPGGSGRSDKTEPA